MSSAAPAVVQNCCNVMSGVPDIIVSAIGSSIIVSIFGVIGYWVKAYFDRKSQKELFDRDNRRQIYEMFLMSFIGAINSAPDSKEHQLALKSYVESRMKIVLLGSEKLMDCLNELSKFSGQDSPEVWNAFRKVALQMRDDFDLKSDGRVDAFSQILFSPTDKKVGMRMNEAGRR